jgi:hypothetical protein
VPPSVDAMMAPEFPTARQIDVEGQDTALRADPEGGNLRVQLPPPFVVWPMTSPTAKHVLDEGHEMRLNPEIPKAPSAVTTFQLVPPSEVDRRLVSPLVLPLAMHAAVDRHDTSLTVVPGGRDSVVQVLPPSTVRTRFPVELITTWQTASEGQTIVLAPLEGMLWFAQVKPPSVVCRTPLVEALIAKQSLTTGQESEPLDPGDAIGRQDHVVPPSVVVISAFCAKFMA